ncbi:tripartite tricarboxylate transporter substrate binding protein, partial [Variovorax sp. 2RAF20]
MFKRQPPIRAGKLKAIGLTGGRICVRSYDTSAYKHSLIHISHPTRRIQLGPANIAKEERARV